ncbi:MAG: nitroreductase family protein [Deltaproteobacteria bacterium]|nr:MAG: nitroreductase family protein [Deltaproteobacteria bacterium]
MNDVRKAVLDAIHTRRSVRTYLDDPVADEDVRIILEAGRWAPSGLNNQPWRFVVVRDPTIKKQIAEQTRYREIIRNAPVIVVVFMDNEVSYDRVKDCQGIGACLQNMWLAAHALNLGAVWLGEILKNKDRVAEILMTPESLELMAVLAVGHPRHGRQSSQRKPLTDLIVKEF